MYRELANSGWVVHSAAGEAGGAAWRGRLGDPKEHLPSAELPSDSSRPKLGQRVGILWGSGRRMESSLPARGGGEGPLGRQGAEVRGRPGRRAADIRAPPGGGTRRRSRPLPG